MFSTNDQNFKVEMTEAAFTQIELIKSNDFTLEDQMFRLKIGGKGCDGFTYDTGFSKFAEGDNKIEFINKDNKRLTLLVDKFTYFYCKEGLIDYVLDTNINQDGFIYTNKNENIYSGKFFKEETLVPTKEDL